MVSVVLADVAVGETFESIAGGYHIEREDIQAALYYAAALSRDQYLPFPEASHSWSIAADL